MYDALKQPDKCRGQNRHRTHPNGINVKSKKQLMNLARKSVWIFTFLIVLLFLVSMITTPFTIFLTSVAITVGVIYQVIIVLKDDVV